MGGKDFDAIPYADDVSLRAPLTAGGIWEPLTGKENLRTIWWAPFTGQENFLDPCSVTNPA